ncbi:MAG TPA: hypothetical protein VI142_00095 [Gaiellaceae bacterium]
MTGAPVLMPLRRRLDVRAFGINCRTAPVGAWQPAYNAACFEAFTGNADGAFEHLARDREDFATLRCDPRWQRLFD